MCSPLTYWWPAETCCIMGKEGVRSETLRMTTTHWAFSSRNSSISLKIITPERQRSITTTPDWKLPSDGHTEKERNMWARGGGCICERPTAVSSSSVPCRLYNQAAQWCHIGENPLCFTLFTRHLRHSSVPQNEHANVQMALLYQGQWTRSAS